jgi:hypothetical protein
MQAVLVELAHLRVNRQTRGDCHPHVTLAGLLSAGDKEPIHMARLPENTSGISVFQQYSIKTFTRPGKTSARAFIGEKPTKVAADAKTIADAVRDVEQQLTARDSARVAERLDGIPVAAEYADALAGLGTKIKKSHWKMLLVHLGALQNAMTTADIAKSAGYASANTQYGALGRLVAEQLGFDPPRREDGTEIWTATLAETTDSSADEKAWHWTMRPQVAECLGSFDLAAMTAPARTESS